MTVWAIGDIQGCYGAFRSLLERIDFAPGRDRLWLCGDLVNRGPGSLETLRFVRDLGDDAVCVLGNHDLHLLAVLAGERAARTHKGDTLDAILRAPDRDAIGDWLRHRPMLHHDPALATTLVHAGLPPQWTLDDAKRCAGEVEAVLRSDDHAAWLATMYGNQPRRWRPDLGPEERLRFTVNCLTRMRYCDAKGRLDFAAKGPPGTQPEGLLPWFEIPGRRTADERIVFGHWSALGRHEAHNVLALDTGCVWGGCLSAVRLDERGAPTWVQVACEDGGG